jgi:hypothetical protein
MTDETPEREGTPVSNISLGATTVITSLDGLLTIPAEWTCKTGRVIADFSAGTVTLQLVPDPFASLDMQIRGIGDLEEHGE